jgi:hypothetical protein
MVQHGCVAVCSSSLNVAGLAVRAAGTACWACCCQGWLWVCACSHTSHIALCDTRGTCKQRACLHTQHGW